MKIISFLFAILFTSIGYCQSDTIKVRTGLSTSAVQALINASKYHRWDSTASGHIHRLSGNVGVGTVTPASKFTVGNGVGNLFLQVNGSSSNIYIGQSGNTRFGQLGASAGILQQTALFPLAIGTFSNYPFILGANNSEVIRISEAGNAGISNNNNTPHASSLLDLTSSTRGLLIPRFTTGQRGNIIGTSGATIPKGLLIYDSTVNSLMTFNGTAWESMKTGINTVNPHASAAVDIPSTTQGLLVPRMTTVQRHAIPSPAEGLLVYDLTTHSMWYFNATDWIEY